jgi:hypothetical protein
MVLWLSSFIDTGYFTNDVDYLVVYRKIVLISMILSGVLLPVIGHFADFLPSAYVVPFAFASRCVAAYFFCQITIPDSLFAYCSCSILILATVV